MNDDKLNDLFAALALPAFFAEGDCVGENPAMWDDEDPQLAFAAKRICADCPVKALCAAWGVANEPQGIWGGLDTKALAKARRGKGKFVSLEERKEDARWMADVLSDQPAAVLAEKYDVAERTVYRWRAKVA